MILFLILLMLNDAPQCSTEYFIDDEKGIIEPISHSVYVYNDYKDYSVFVNRVLLTSYGSTDLYDDYTAHRKGKPLVNQSRHNDQISPGSTFAYIYKKGAASPRLKIEVSEHLGDIIDDWTSRYEYRSLDTGALTEKHIICSEEHGLYEPTFKTTSFDRFGQEDNYIEWTEYDEVTGKGKPRLYFKTLYLGKRKILALEGSYHEWLPFNITIYHYSRCDKLFPDWDIIKRYPVDDLYTLVH